MFYTFFCLPAGLYSEHSPCYYESWKRISSAAACLCKDVPNKLADAAETTTTKRDHSEEAEKATRKCGDPLRDTCATLFLPDNGRLSQCLYHQTVSCNFENPLDGLKPLIMCTYQTFRAAGSPQVALKTFANVLYSLMDLSNVPQWKKLLESGLKLVNNSAVWYPWLGVVPVKMPGPVAAKSLIDAVGSCPMQEKSHDATLVCTLSWMVKDLTLFGKDLKWTLQKSAEALVCDILKSYLAEKEISQPSELFDAVNQLYSLFDCRRKQKSE